VTVPKVVFDISMSLDGFMTAANQRPDEPMGPGGHVLHDWAFAGDEQDRKVLEEGGAATGAVIAGRRTYDTSIAWWGADGPTGDARLPVIVVSHREAAEVPDGSVYSFVDGIEPALAAARRAAGDQDLCVMGGADIGSQYLRAGLVDELSLHVVPVFFGSGTRMFEAVTESHRPLELLSVVHTANAIHLRARVPR
jgi:dihydrofolate reductase